MALIMIVLWLIISIGTIILGGILEIVILIPVGIIGLVVSFVALFGLRGGNPKEALVLVLFGKCYGTIKKEGFYLINY